MSKRISSSHSMARRNKSVNNSENTERKAADIKGATEVMKDLIEKDSKKKIRNFDPSELSDLKDLVFLGKQSTVVEISNYKFELSTLTNSERREVVRYLAGKGKELSAYIPMASVAMSIQKINEVPIEDIYEQEYLEEFGGSDLSLFQKKLMVVDEWQAGLVKILFKEYEKLNLRADSIFNEDSEGEDKLKK